MKFLGKVISSSDRWRFQSAILLALAADALQIFVLPAFAGELVPGVDVVPFWTFAVANVYRKWKQNLVPDDTGKSQVIEGEFRSS